MYNIFHFTDLFYNYNHVSVLQVGFSKQNKEQSSKHMHELGDNRDIDVQWDFTFFIVHDYVFITCIFFSFPEDLDEEVYLVSYTIFYDIQDHLIRIILNNNRNKCGNR